MTIRVGTRKLAGRTRNVSRGGLCADLAEPIVNGADVEVDIVLVFDDDLQSEALTLPARVVWCTEVNDANQVGIVFKPLDAQKLECLTLFLSYLDDARATKAPRDIPVDERFG